MSKMRMTVYCLAAVLFLSLASARANSDNPSTSAAPPKGQRVFICGHSFHVFVGPMIATVAKAAGITDHVAAGTQSIGGSTVTQHWNLGDPEHPDPKHPDVKNQVKLHLTAGDIDVLTLSPHMRLVPDKAIDDFTELAVAHHPNIRILVQESWVIFDSLKPPVAVKKNEERDQRTIEQVRPPLQDFKAGLDKQAKEINARLGKQVIFVIPVGDALLSLREKVLKGEVPGIARQSELFADAAGHVKAPVQQLEAYCYFAAIYHRSPVGLACFENPGDEQSHKLNLILQQTAWDTVTADPMSGVSEK